MLKKITDSQRKALVFIKKGGCSGVIDRYGRVVVAGETLSTVPETYLRLVAWGLLIGGGGRLNLTSDGVIMANIIISKQGASLNVQKQKGSDDEE